MAKTRQKIKKILPNQSIMFQEVNININIPVSDV